MIHFILKKNIRLDTPDVDKQLMYVVAARRPRDNTIWCWPIGYAARPKELREALAKSGDSLAGYLQLDGGNSHNIVARPLITSGCWALRIPTPTCTTGGIIKTSITDGR